MDTGAILIPDPAETAPAEGSITGFRFLSAAQGTFQLVSLQVNSSELDSYIIQDLGDSIEGTDGIAVIDGNITKELTLGSGDVLGFLLVSGALPIPLTNTSVDTTPSCSVSRLLNFPILFYQVFQIHWHLWKQKYVCLIGGYDNNA